MIRATSVVRILIKNYGVNPLQIQPSGRGEYMPVDDNETAEGRGKNRRTEIIMAPKLDKLFQMLQTSERRLNKKIIIRDCQKVDSLLLYRNKAIIFIALYDITHPCFY